MPQLASLLCISAVFSFGVPATNPAVRPVVCLNGNWQFQPADDQLTFPPAADWDKTPIRIPSPWNVNAFTTGDGGDFRCYPSYPDSWEKVRCAWQRRTFQVPAAWRGKRVFLRFNAVDYWADVYVNGQKVGSHEGGFTPFEIDITSAVRFGATNRVTVGVKDRHFFDVHGRTPYGWGSFWGEIIRGIWQDVYLLAKPEDYLRDPFVHYSIAYKTLHAEATVVNTGASPLRARFAAVIYAWDHGEWRKAKPSLTVPAVTVEVPAGGSKLATLDASWPDAKLWWPDSPNLYVASLRLVPEGSSGAAGDAATTASERDELPVRFGCKELTIGPKGKFLLNGKTWTGRGDAWHFMGIPQMTPNFARAWYAMAKSAHINIIRLHAQIYPEYYLDVADEMGMLIVDESALWGSAGNFYYNAGFRRRGMAMVRDLVLRDRNHPSVALWSVGNEVTWMNPQAAGVKSKADIQRLFADLAGEMRRLDPTRQVSCDGDGDLGGHLPIFSLHYPGPDKPKNPAKIFTIGESGQMYYSRPDICAYRLGDSVYLTNNNRLEAVGRETEDLIEGYRRWAAYATPFNVQWYGLQPLPFDLTFHWDRLDTPGVKPERLGPYTSGLNAWHDPKLPAFIPNPVYRHVQDAFVPVRFFIDERGQSAYVPDALVRHFDVHNDTLKDRDLELRWTLTADGRPLARAAVRVSLAAGDWKRVGMRLLLPGLAQPVRAESTVALTEGDTTHYTDHRAMYLYPRDLPVRYAAPVAVVGGDAAKALAAALGAGTPALADLGAFDKWLGPRVAAVCVLAPDATLTPRDRQRLTAWVGQGLSVLDLTPGGQLLFSGLDGGSWGADQYKLAFAKVPDSPLLAGLTAAQLCYWLPDGLVASRAFWGVPPRAMTPLVTCGDGRAAVLDAPVGRGRVVTSSLRLAADAATEPAARVLLRNAVGYLASAAPLHPAKVAVAPGEDGGCRLSLFSFGLWNPDQPGGQQGAAALPAGPVGVFVVSASALTPAVLRAARASLAAGGKVLVVNATADSAAALGRLVGGDVTLTAADLIQLVPAKGEAGDSLLRGFDLSDLYWLNDKGTQTILPWAIAVKGVPSQPILVNNHLDWRRWVNEPENKKPGALRRTEVAPYVEKAGLVRVPEGKGEVLLSSIPVVPTSQKSMRVLAQLLTNLGVSWQARALSPAKRADFNLRVTGSIVRWLTLGPIQGKPAAQLYADDLIGGETSARPAVGELSGDSAWVLRDTPPAVDLSDKSWFGQLPNAAIYFATYLKVPTARRALILVGSDDDVKVWLNGDLVHAFSGARPLTPDQDRVGPVPLVAGWNRLLVKVVNRSGNWGVSVRVVDVAGKPFKDISLSADDPQVAFTEIPTAGWTATSNPPGDTAAAFDRKPETRWSSNKPQDDTMSYTLDMGKEHKIRRVILNTVASPGDWPRGLMLQTSLDGHTWRDVFSAKDGAQLEAEGVTYATFAPVEARYVRLRQTGPPGCSGGLYWSIHELYVYR